MYLHRKNLNYTQYTIVKSKFKLNQFNRTHFYFMTKKFNIPILLFVLLNIHFVIVNVNLGNEF